MQTQNMACILLEGPPGTGKTVISQAVANSLGIIFSLILPSDISGKLVREYEEKLIKILDNAQKNACQIGYYCLIVDKCETIFGKKKDSYSTAESSNNVKNIYNIWTADLICKG